MYQSIFFIDLDGTIIQEIEPRHYYIPPDLPETFYKLKKANCLPVVCTARQPAFVKKLFGNLFTAGIFFNGTYIVYEGNIILKKSYTENQLSQLFQYAQRAHCGLILQSTNYAWGYAVDQQYFPLLNQTYYIDDYMRNVSSRKGQPIYAIDTFFLEAAQYESAQKNIKYPYTLDYHTGDLTGALSSETMNKGIAALILCRHMKISPAKCYAIGNSNNDIPLLLCVGHRIAVQNACLKLLKAADYITNSCTENGIRNAVQYIVSEYTKD